VFYRVDLGLCKGYDGMVGYTMVVYPDRWWYGGTYVFYMVDVG